MAFKMKGYGYPGKSPKMTGSPAKVTYKEAYAAQSEAKKESQTFDEFKAAAEQYNINKYGTTEPTATASKANISKEELAKKQSKKNSGSTQEEPTPKTKRQVRLEEKQARIKELGREESAGGKRAAQRLENVNKRTAERQASRAKVKADREAREAKRLA